MKRASRQTLSHLPTEQPNAAAKNLDLKSALEIARVINSQDAKVAAAVKAALPQIARGIDAIADALKRGGRLIYVGAGTSGRLAALDASECPPTFNTDPKTVQFVIAGGIEALHSATEASEDSGQLGAREIAKKKPGKNDVVVGIAASGRTPFTIAAVECARRVGGGQLVGADEPVRVQRLHPQAHVLDGGEQVAVPDEDDGQVGGAIAQLPDAVKTNNKRVGRGSLHIAFRQVFIKAVAVRAGCDSSRRERGVGFGLSKHSCGYQ